MKDTLIPKLVYDYIPTERTNVDRQKKVVDDLHM